jgi:hypothetical protein
MKTERGSTRSQSGEIALDKVMDCDNTNFGKKERKKERIKELMAPGRPFVGACMYLYV